MICALLHSIGGEVWPLCPLFRQGGNRVLDSQLARRVLRFAWHVTSLSRLVIAVFLAMLVQSGAALAGPGFGITGGLFLTVGLVNLILTLGWQQTALGDSPLSLGPT